MKNSNGQLAAGFAAMALVALFAPEARAQDVVVSEERMQKRVIAGNLAIVPMGMYNVEYEHPVLEKLSLYGGGTLIYADGSLLNPQLRSRGASVNVGVRYYVLGTAPEGLFGCVFLRGMTASITDQHGSANGYSGGLGAFAGYSHIFFDHLHLSLGFGAHALVGSVAGTHAMPTGFALDPEARVMVGVAF